MFSESSISRLSNLDLKKGFENLGIVCEEADCRLLLVRYDADEDLRLGFWEFSNILMSIDPTLREELERRTSNEEMSPETRHMLKTVFRHAIDAECMVESIRQTVEKSMPVSLRTIFDQLDWLKRGFLTSSEFRRYFTGYPDETASLRDKATGNVAQQIEMEGLLRRFNKDKLNGRVSLPEFMDGLTPKCSEKQF